MHDDVDYFTSHLRSAFLALGSGIVGIGLFRLAAPPLDSGSLLLTLAIGALGVSALVWNHTHPRLVAAIVLATTALTPMAAPAGWAMMFLLGFRSSRRVTILFLLAGVMCSAGLFALYLARWTNTYNAGLATLIAIFSIFMTAGAGVSGIVAGAERRRKAQVTELFLDAVRQAPRITERATHAERARITRLLHDEIGHNLALINLFVTSIESTRLTDDELREALVTIREQNRAAARALASTVTRLTTEPVVACLEERLRELAGEVRRAGLMVTIDIPDRLVLEGPQADFIVRTVREGLTNAVKYARPARAGVFIAGDERSRTTVVTVTSPYAGGAGEEQGVSSGNGISSLQKDAPSVGGHVTFATDETTASLTLTLSSHQILTVAQFPQRRGHQAGVEEE